MRLSFFIPLACLCFAEETSLAAPSPPRPPTVTGTIIYDDGMPAADALIAFADPETGIQIRVVATNGSGRYATELAPGEYAVAIAASNGFRWIDRQILSAGPLTLSLSDKCQHLVGHVDHAPSATRLSFERQGSAKGDTFVTTIGRDGKFGTCLPEAQYKASLVQGALSRSMTVDLTAATSLRIEGFAPADVRHAPTRAITLKAELSGLVADVVARNPKLVGIGEATHGTAELTTTRGELTFELIRRAGATLLLFEFDAIASVAIDDYVNGGNVDLGKAVAALGFWITDTYEFRHFLEALRAYNTTAAEKVHVWGIDAQNTTLPVDVLVANATELAITSDEQAVLKRMTKRGKAVLELSNEARAQIDALLARIAKPRSTSQHELVTALAARSLAIQLDYWTGDMSTWYRKRRDHGMAELARFIVAQTGTRRAIVWAHDAHITKEPNEPMLGHHLALDDGGYYAIGTYLYQGSARAWDAASKVGVISHAIPPAPDYTVEGALMVAAGQPQVAWVPLHRVPPGLAKWLETPRYVREIYATYGGADAMMVLRDERAGFDAIVVVRTGHDSSPTPTGTRTVEHK